MMGSGVYFEVFFDLDCTHFEGKNVNSVRTKGLLDSK